VQSNNSTYFFSIDYFTNTGADAITSKFKSNNFADLHSSWV